MQTLANMGQIRLKPVRDVRLSSLYAIVGQYWPVHLCYWGPDYIKFVMGAMSCKISCKLLFCGYQNEGKSWRTKIVMMRVQNTIRGGSQTIGNSLLRSFSLTLNQPLKYITNTISARNKKIAEERY